MTANRSLPVAKLRNIQDDVPEDSEIGNDEIVFWHDSGLRARGNINGVLQDIAPFDSAVTSTGADVSLLAGLAAAGYGVITGSASAVARTATVAGATTGTIADAGMLQFVAVTSANAAHICILPAPTPGRIVVLYVGSNGFEVASSDPATIAINGGSEASASSSIAANMLAVLICTSATTWHGFTITGATLAAIEAAAAPE